MAVQAMTPANPLEPALLGDPARHAADRLTRAGHADDGPQRAAAVEFEAVFLAEMLAPMFENLETDGLFGGGPSERIYRAMLVQEYGKAIARAGGIGIADAVQQELIKLQETTK